MLNNSLKNKLSVLVGGKCLYFSYAFYKSSLVYFLSHSSYKITYQLLLCPLTPSLKASFLLYKTSVGNKSSSLKESLKRAFSILIPIFVIDGTFNLGSMLKYKLINFLSKNGTLASNPLSATPLSALKTS